MEEKRITASTVDTKEIEQLYQTAFPVEEQIPWQQLLRLVDDMPLDFTAYYDNGAFVGMTVVYQRIDYNWLWYFAVSEHLRGRGYGQLILSKLISKHDGRNIILDMESPDQPSENAEQRMRRLKFYTRNGFHDTHAHKTYDDIEYTIMMRGDGVFTTADYDNLISDLQRFWWKE